MLLEGVSTVSESAYNPRMYESDHNYRSNMNGIDHTVKFDHTRRILVSFSDTTRTEGGCDYVSILKGDGSSRSNRWGEEMSGSSFPGQPARNNTPLIVDDDKFCVHFRSDGSVEEWGYRLFAWPISSGPEVCDSAVVLESPHPYSANTDWQHTMKFPGATSVKVSFDSRSRTEGGNDLVKIRQGSAHGAVRETCSGTNFPGFGGRPDLDVRGDTVSVSFKSDGSN